MDRDYRLGRVTYALEHTLANHSAGREVLMKAGLPEVRFFDMMKIYSSNFNYSRWNDYERAVVTAKHGASMFFIQMDQSTIAPLIALPVVQMKG